MLSKHPCDHSLVPITDTSHCCPGSGLPPQLSPRSVLRETQSCELMNSLKLGQVSAS